MIKQLKIYLDTSVINFLFAADAPEKKEITIEFFERYIKTAVYETFISPFVEDEINQTDDDAKKEQLLNVIADYNLDYLPVSSEEIEKLVSAYLKEQIVPQNKLLDALHVAIATVNNMDFLVSWNFRHLANISKEAKFIAVNAKYNYYHPLRIITPYQLMYE
jgi:predicted nucleic acid-binding protein